MPASPSATPSMRPRAAAGAPNETRRLGNKAVGISWPTSARKLAAPMPTTPADSQDCSASETGEPACETAGRGGSNPSRRRDPTPQGVGGGLNTRPPRGPNEIGEAAPAPADMPRQAG